MPQNGIRPPGIESLTSALVQNRNLRVLDLNDNTITSAAGKLASAVSKLPRLEILNLESSLIRTKGASAIARAIVSHRNLKVNNSSYKKTKSFSHERHSHFYSGTLSRL